MKINCSYYFIYLAFVLKIDRHNSFYTPFIVTYEKSRGFYGNDAKPFEAHLTTDSANQPCWVTRDVAENNAQKAINLLKEGMTQKDIAIALGVNKSTVSRYMANAKQTGLLGNLKNEQ